MDEQDWLAERLDRLASELERGRLTMRSLWPRLSTSAGAGYEGSRRASRPAGAQAMPGSSAFELYRAACRRALTVGELPA